MEYRRPTFWRGKGECRCGHRKNDFHPNGQACLALGCGCTKFRRRLKVKKVAVPR
jgi:hypothetical protein